MSIVTDAYDINLISFNRIIGFIITQTMCICCFKDINWEAWTALGTVFMAVVTFITLLISKRQIEETRKQIKESNRPRIIISIQIREGDFLLRIENTGMTPALVSKLRFNDFFKEKLMVKQLRDRFIYLEEAELVINAKRKQVFRFSSHDGTFAM